VDQQQANGGILLGGPRDQSEVETTDAPVIHLQIDNLVHRYIRTHQHRTVDGRPLVVYNYDGEERVQAFRESASPESG
jgi:hypothetical protein